MSPLASVCVKGKQKLLGEFIWSVSVAPGFHLQSHCPDYLMDVQQLPLHSHSHPPVRSPTASYSLQILVENSNELRGQWTSDRSTFITCTQCRRTRAQRHVLYVTCTCQVYKPVIKSKYVAWHHIYIHICCFDAAHVAS